MPARPPTWAAPGYGPSIGNAINANGDVAGYSHLTVRKRLWPTTAFLAAAARGYTMSDLGVPTGRHYARRSSLNKYDMAVGTVPLRPGIPATTPSSGPPASFRSTTRPAASQGCDGAKT